MQSCSFNEQRAARCEAHNLDWSLLFMGGALSLLGMGHRGIGGSLARNLGAIALGTAAASLLRDRPVFAANELGMAGAERIRDVEPQRVREPYPSDLKDSVDMASYESFPASDPPAIR